MPEPATFRYLPPERADTLRGLSWPVRRPVEGPLQGQHRSPHFGASVEFAEYRPYVPGDPVNRIDWAVYSRSDRYVIRRYQEETNLQAWVLLDTSGSMGFRGEEAEAPKFAYACEVAAAVLFILIQQGDTAGLSLFNTALGESFPPAAGYGALAPMLRALETAQPAGESRIEAALHATAEHLSRRSLVVLVSDLLEEAPAILRGVDRLHHDGHEVTVIHLLDRDELSLRPHGMVEFRAMEGAQRLVVETEGLRTAYAREVELHIQALRTGCQGVGADYLFTDTHTAVEAALAPRVARP